MWLVNARDVKHLPGRSKTDLDCVWLCKLNEWGMLRRSFVPPEPVRDLRALGGADRAARGGGAPSRAAQLPRS